MFRPQFLSVPLSFWTSDWVDGYKLRIPIVRNTRIPLPCAHGHVSPACKSLNCPGMSVFERREPAQRMFEVCSKIPTDGHRMRNYPLFLCTFATLTARCSRAYPPSRGRGIASSWPTPCSSRTGSSGRRGSNDGMGMYWARGIWDGCEKGDIAITI